MESKITNEQRDDLIRKASLKTGKKAQLNIIQYGLQDKRTILIAMMEELGEIARADLENEGIERVISEARDLGALCIQMECLLGSGEL